VPYRFAIIGCGRIAQKHAQLIAKQGILAAVCDIDLSRAQKLASAYGAACYDNTHTLFKENRIDIVCVCSPNGWHEAHSIEALQQGCHVLCEKPMAIRTESAARMLEVSQQTGKKLYVVKQNRFNPPVVAVKKMLDKGSLGTIHAFQMNCFWNRPHAYFKDDWRGTLQWDGGTLFTQFSHFIDLLYWMLGDLGTASGYRENALHQGIIEFEDQGAALLHMRSGTRGVLQYTLNAYEKNMEGSITLFGDRGTVKIGGAYLNRLDHFSVEGEMHPFLGEGSEPNKYGTYEGSMSNHPAVYDQLFRDLENTENALVEASEALQTVSIIEKIYDGSPLTRG